MPEELRVEGSATMYRLHDVGYAIALDRAAELLGHRTRGRAVPSRLEARAIQIRNPPLFAALGTHALTLDGRPCTAAISAHLFDFGVCSLQLRVATPTQLSWSTFADFGAALERSTDVDAMLDGELEALLQSIRPAVERPALAPVAEEYRVYRVDRLVAGSEAPREPVVSMLTDAHLLSLLLSERRHLSDSARRELIPARFSYYDDDLVVLTWESALVVEPRPDDRDIEYVLEFANAQLLEIRLFDAQLDGELPDLYDRVSAARTRRRPRLAGRFRAVLSDLQTRVADVTETVERVENALKATNDVYLSRVYAAALELFREGDWRRGVERKLSILRETYAMLSSEAQAARAELLEIAIIVLIVAELVLAALQARR